MRGGASLLVVAFALDAFSTGLGLGAIGPSLPSMHERLHAPLGSLGLLLGGEYLGSLLATLALGPLLDHRSPRPMIVGGFLLTAVGFALVPLANGLALAVAALAIAGMGVGAAAVGAPVLIARQGGRQEGRALSIINMAFGAGAFVGPLSAGWALDVLHDYRPIFYAFSASLALPLLAVAAAPLLPPQAPVKRRLGSLPTGAWSLALMLAAVSFLYLAAEVGFGSWVYTYVRGTTHAGVNAASAASAAFWLSLSASSLGTALRPRAWHADRVILVGGAAGAGAALLFLAAPTSSTQIAAAVLVGLALGPIYPLNLGAAANLFPAASGQVSTVVICSSQLGGAVGPWLQGQVITRSYHLGIGLTIGLCAGLAGAQGAYLALRRQRGQLEAKPLTP
ncbi:MAG TPA: MFS transporter [Chloroflexota bacterium]|nr:MFS transporter [Chloroflexota bacterium]